MSKVDHPTHYNSHPSGVEAIEIVQYMGFCLGNAFKYVYRYQHKNGTEDLKKQFGILNTSRQLYSNNILR